MAENTVIIRWIGNISQIEKDEWGRLVYVTGAPFDTILAAVKGATKNRMYSRTWKAWEVPVGEREDVIYALRRQGLRIRIRVELFI